MSRSKVSAQGNVPGLTSDLEDQTVGESERRPFAEEIESGRDDLGVLQRQVFMIEQHVDGRTDLRRRPLVHGVENPDSLRQDEVRNPRALGDELLGRERLIGVVARNEPHEHISVNCAHGAYGRTCGFPLLHQ